MTEEKLTQEVTEPIKEKIIGDITPKKKFLNFVTAVGHVRVRFLTNVALIKGEKLSGLGLENVIFKLTLCDEGTIKFEEVDTNKTDFQLRKRLIDDICDEPVTGYAQKFVISTLEFVDKDGTKCYLEVDTLKPIDRLKSIFDEVDTSISEKGLSFLDDLLSDLPEEEAKEEEDSKEEVMESQTSTYSTSMMEEAFKKMNEDKINELKYRIEDTEKDILKTKSEINNAEAKLKKNSSELRVLNTRLESMTPGDEPNGHIFFITEEQKNETGLDDSTKAIADKIADLMNLKKDVLFNYLTGGFYKIKIAKKGEIDKKIDKIDSEILEKMSTIDVVGKLTMIDSDEFEYRGELNWHQLVARMIRKGFEQDPEFDKQCHSNSYESKELGKLDQTKEDPKGCGENCDGECNCNDECGSDCNCSK